jgi:hypothetical protein
LEWSSKHGFVLVKQDVKTIPRFAYQRVTEGKEMPGVNAIPNLMPPSQAIDQLNIIVGYSLPNELENFVLRLPL